MNTKNIKTLLSTALLGALVFTSCADLGVDNLNEPTKEAVEGSAENQAKLLAGGFYDLTTALHSSYSTHPDLLADQITSTNNVRNFWDFAQEPKIRLSNSPTYSGANSYAAFYGGFNSSVSTANLFINNIVNNGLVINDATGVDVTSNILAQAYLLRGLARGYLGMMYNQAFLIDENFVIGEDTPQFAPYGELIDASISDLDQAIALGTAADATTFIFNTMPNPADTWDKNEFLDIANSYAAKILAGEARTAAQAASADWTSILSYAQKGIGGPNASSTLGVFANANIGSAGEFASYYNDWSNFIVSCATSAVSSCSGYLPTDLKVIHSMDPAYPTTYPADSAQGTVAALYPATTADPRLEGYYVYTTNAGFLRSARNPALYSNYFSGRLYSGNDWWKAANDVVFFTDTETELLIAEAQVMLGSIGDAATTLGNSTAGTGTTTIGFTLDAEAGGVIADGSLSGGYTFTGTETVPQMQFALMREYGVEVATLGATGTNWFFMRRHDMLQAGTPTMFPVPVGELEILGITTYQYGGVDDAGTVGTASGANSWKDLAGTAGLKARTKAINSVDRPATFNDAVIDVNSAKSNIARKTASEN
ncbi:MAG: hypothetical protein BalsKO_03240 [Balneolaceae bacterium]